MKTKIREAVRTGKRSLPVSNDHQMRSICLNTIPINIEPNVSCQ